MPDLWVEACGCQRYVHPLLGQAGPHQGGAAVSRCELCSCPLLPGNISGVCRECRTHREPPGCASCVEERWRDLGDGEHVVTERGRVARLLNVDRAHPLPAREHRRPEACTSTRSSPRPGADPGLRATRRSTGTTTRTTRTPTNIRWATPAENAADRERTRERNSTDRKNAAPAALSHPSRRPWLTVVIDECQRIQLPCVHEVANRRRGRKGRRRRHSTSPHAGNARPAFRCRTGRD